MPHVRSITKDRQLVRSLYGQDFFSWPVNYRLKSKCGTVKRHPGGVLAFDLANGTITGPVYHCSTKVDSASLAVQLLSSP